MNCPQCGEHIPDRSHDTMARRRAVAAGHAAWGEARGFKLIESGDRRMACRNHALAHGAELRDDFRLWLDNNGCYRVRGSWQCLIGQGVMDRLLRELKRPSPLAETIERCMVEVPAEPEKRPTMACPSFNCLWIGTKEQLIVANGACRCPECGTVVMMLALNVAVEVPSTIRAEGWFYRAYLPDDPMPDYGTMEPVTLVPIHDQISDFFATMDLKIPVGAAFYRWGGSYWVVYKRRVWGVSAEKLERAGCDGPPPVWPHDFLVDDDDEPLPNMPCMTVPVVDDSLIHCEREECGWSGREEDLAFVNTKFSGGPAYTCPECARQFEQMRPDPFVGSDAGEMVSTVEPEDADAKLYELADKLLWSMRLSQGQGMGDDGMRQKLVDLMKDLGVSRFAPQPGPQAEFMAAPVDICPCCGFDRDRQRNTFGATVTYESPNPGGRVVRFAETGDIDLQLGDMCGACDNQAIADFLREHRLPGDDGTGLFDDEPGGVV